MMDWLSDVRLLDYQQEVRKRTAYLDPAVRRRDNRAVQPIGHIRPSQRHCDSQPQ
jgi:hypothetical protein